MSSSAGDRLRAAVEAEKPLQVVGTINAYSALLAQRAVFKALTSISRDTKKCGTVVQL